MDLNPEVESHIGRNVPWGNLPLKVKEIFGNSHKGYEKAVINYSIRNQLRYSENLVRTIRKDEGKYFEEVVAYSKDHLMLYPYHLSHRVVKGLRITPFQYYISILEKLMDHEKSYDSLPNFTAADCLRLLGIGRNQYIELMNQHRSSRKLFRKKAPRDYLPARPVDITIEPWFLVEIGYVTEDDVSAAKPNERELIDSLIDNGGQEAGKLSLECVQCLYRKGLVYLDVPIDRDDYIVVPPLEGFVMNRVLGDYFEILLYKIFVSIDEHTTVQELSHVLGIDTQLIKNAVSLYCRLGFAYKKNLEIDFSTLHPSWKKYHATFPNRKIERIPYVVPDQSQIALELSLALNENDSSGTPFPESTSMNMINSPETPGSVTHSVSSSDINSSFLSTSQSMTGISKRIAFLYDSTLTAFLMMGNLSPGLKNHAVTMFEVGKMADESLDSFLTELEQISWHEGEGEALRYFEHAKTLRKAILFLRNNPKVGSMSLDLLRCESLLNLDSVTCSRLLNKNYTMLVSMAPLSYEVRPVCSNTLPHFGPCIPQVNSIWFKLYLYSATNSGPPSLLLTRGTILTELPVELEDCNKYLVTSWGHDSGIIPGSNGLFTLNDALCHSAVFVQAYGLTGESATVIVPFPFTKNKDILDVMGMGDMSSSKGNMNSKWAKHPAIIKLSRIIDLEKSCGYITMMKIRGSSRGNSESNAHINVSQSMEKVVTLPNLVEEDSDNSCIKIKDSDDDEDQIIFVSSNSNSIPVPEPKNGFKDDKCAKLYEEELESLINLEEEVECMKPNVFDARQQKIESLRLELTTDINISVTQCDSNSQTFSIEDNNQIGQERVWFDDWTLLDCQFGLPLFDSGVNRTVSERIVSNGLWEEQSLESLVKSNQELGKQLTEFISTYQPPNIWNEETPLPSKNFYCLNGRLREFEPL